MRRKTIWKWPVRVQMLVLGIAIFSAGCGAIELVDVAKDSARDAIVESVDETVDEFVGDLVGFDSLRLPFDNDEEDLYYDDEEDLYYDDEEDLYYDYQEGLYYDDEDGQ